MNGQQHKPVRVSEMFASKWLSAADLPKPVTVTINAVNVQSLRQPDGSEEPKLIISFNNASKKMICNATQAKTLAAALGDLFGDWPGARVRLAASKAPNGRDTIAVLEATKLPDRVLKEMPAPPAPPAQPQADPNDPDPELWKGRQ